MVRERDAERVSRYDASHSVLGWTVTVPERRSAMPGTVRVQASDDRNIMFVVQEDYNLIP